MVQPEVYTEMQYVKQVLLLKVTE